MLERFSSSPGPAAAAGQTWVAGASPPPPSSQKADWGRRGHGLGQSAVSSRQALSEILLLQYALLSFHHQPHTPSSFHLGAALVRQGHPQAGRAPKPPASSPPPGPRVQKRASRGKSCGENSAQAPATVSREMLPAAMKPKEGRLTTRNRKSGS